MIKLDEVNSKKYKIEAMSNNEVYTKELDSDHLLGLLIFSFEKKLP